MRIMILLIDLRFLFLNYHPAVVIQIWFWRPVHKPCAMVSVHWKSLLNYFSIYMAQLSIFWSLNETGILFSLSQCFFFNNAGPTDKFLGCIYVNIPMFPCSLTCFQMAVRPHNFPWGRRYIPCSSDRAPPTPRWYRWLLHDYFPENMLSLVHTAGLNAQISFGIPTVQTASYKWPNRMCVFRQQSFADMAMLVVIVMTGVCLVVEADWRRCSCFLLISSYVAS
jgi:hypothetical protein